jgi:hypothetical protein
VSPFRRRRREEDEPVDLAPEESTVVDAAPERPLTTGPWDIEDAPDDDVARLDLGSLRVPVPEGAELRLEVDEQSQQVIAAVAVLGPNAIQIGAFAAPRSSGIWSEVADEITQGLRAAGGSSEPAEGPFGRELLARVPMEAPGGGRTVSAARFIGVDGPRWFLRGMVQGPAAADPVQAKKLEDIFRAVIVVRGTEAMAPRDPLPLQVPRDVADQVAEAQHAHEHDHNHGHDHGAQAQPQYDDLNPFERGPEITEIR